jgi:hypothetical protein
MTKAMVNAKASSPVIKPTLFMVLLCCWFIAGFCAVLNIGKFREENPIQNSSASSSASIGKIKPACRQAGSNAKTKAKRPWILPVLYVLELATKP